VRRIGWVACALLLAVACGCAQRAARPRVLVVGVDGADWEMIVPMVARGELPTFARLIERGATAPAITLQPPLSPLLWTSIATGRSPDEHGILDFVARDPATGRTIPVTSTLRRVKAIWNIATESDLRASVVGWLATWPAEPVSGVMVTDRLAFHPFDAGATGGAAEGVVAPRERAAEIAAMMPAPAAVPFDSVSRFLAISPDAYAAAPFDAYRPGQLVGNFRRTLAAAEGYRRVCLSLLERESWDLFLGYFEFLDATSHLFVRHMSPALAQLPEEEKAAFGAVVEEAYRWQDRVLGEILERAGDDAIVLVVSDHGFLYGERRIGAPSEVLGGEAALWHRDEGIFIAAGPGVRSGARLAPVSILDVTPTILWLCGLPIAADMDGRPIVEAFDERFVRGRRARSIPTYETEARETEVVAGGADEEIQERLRALGYIGGAAPAGEGVNAILHRAIVLRDRGDWAGALGEWERARALAPSRSDVAIGLGFALLQLGRMEEARREWERALEVDPRCAEAHLNLGNLALQEGDADAAMARYRAAIAADSLNPDAYVNLAQVQIDQGEFLQAIETLQPARAIAPGSAAVRFRCGVAMVAIGDDARAKAEFTRALELDRNLEVPVGIWMGRVAERARDWDAAAAAFERVIRADARNVPARLDLARVYEASGRRDRAGQVLVEALRVDPDNVEAKASLEALSRGAPPPAPEPVPRPGR
jgi:tetratricopeptide (TPR) repeat protein